MKKQRGSINTAALVASLTIGAILVFGLFSSWHNDRGKKQIMQMVEENCEGMGVIGISTGGEVIAMFDCKGVNESE